MRAYHILFKTYFNTENIPCKFSRNFPMHPLSKFLCNRKSEAAGSLAPGCIRLIKSFKYPADVDLFRMGDAVADP